jgi:hypothetical protein
VAKVASQQTLSPSAVSLGAPVLNAHVRAASRAVAYAAARRAAHVHLSLGSTAVGSIDRAPLGIELPAPSSWVTEIETDVWIDADTQVVELGAEVTVASGTTVEIRWTIGAGTVTTSHAFGAVGTEVVGTLSRAAIGGAHGWQLMTVEVRVAAGTNVGTRIETLRVQDQVIAASALPDPPTT